MKGRRGDPRVRMCVVTSYYESQSLITTGRENSGLMGLPIFVLLSRLLDSDLLLDKTAFTTEKNFKVKNINLSRLFLHYITNSWATYHSISNFKLLQHIKHIAIIKGNEDFKESTVRIFTAARSSVKVAYLRSSQCF